MTATTWMDAQAALDNGFIDSVVDNDQFGMLTNSGQLRTADLKEAKEKVQAWLDRHTPHKPQLSRPVQGDDHTSDVAPANEQAEMPVKPGGTAPLTVPVESIKPQDETPAAPEPPIETGTNKQPKETGTPVAQLQKRLGLLMPAKRSN